jgi:hypothetical protein
MKVCLNNKWPHPPEANLEEIQEDSNNKNQDPKERSLEIIDLIINMEIFKDPMKKKRKMIAKVKEKKMKEKN